MIAAKQRLTHLLELAADETAEGRRVLVGELCALLLAWPADYPLAMRTPFEQLLEKVAHDLNRQSRADLAARFAVRPDAPVALLNQLFFDAPEAVKAAILRRNALAGEDEAALSESPAAADEGALVAAARARHRDGFTAEFARILGLDGDTAGRILTEPSGEALAAACKGAHLTRATFSTLALLFAPEGAGGPARLGVYDAVPLEGAESLVRFWRSHRAESASQDVA